MPFNDKDCESSVCFLCENIEENLSRIIECTHCGRCVHFHCKKVFGNAVKKMRGKPFFCSAECIDMHSKTSQRNPECADIIEEMRALAQAVREAKQESTNIRIIFEKTGLQIITLVETTNRIEESQVFLANQFDSIQSDFNSFKTEMNELKQKTASLEKEVGDWQQKYQYLTSSVDQLELEMDKITRAKLSKNAILLGIPYVENENVNDIVHRTGKTVGCSFDANAFQAKRLYAKSSSLSSPILISFISDSLKEQFFECKREYGALMASEISESFAGFSRRVTIRDELTAYSRELLRMTKERQALLDIKYVRPGRGGIVIIKRSEGR